MVTAGATRRRVRPRRRQPGAFVERLAGWVRRPERERHRPGHARGGRPRPRPGGPAGLEAAVETPAGRWSSATAPARRAPPRCSSTATTTCSRPTRWTPGPARRSSPRSATAACTAAAAPTTRASTWPSSWPWRACWPPGASCRARSRCCWTARRRSARPTWPPSPAPAGAARRRPGGLERRAGRPGRRLAAGVRGQGDRQLRAAGQGANRSLHSGNWGGVVPNPLWTLVQLLASMRDATAGSPWRGSPTRSSRWAPDERAALDRLPVDVDAVKAELGLDELDAPAERGFAERLAAWPTLTINGLHGGYGGPGTQTVLPSAAVAKCDVRLVHAQRAADVYEKLEAHVRGTPPGSSSSARARWSRRGPRWTRPSPPRSAPAWPPPRGRPAARPRARGQPPAARVHRGAGPAHLRDPARQPRPGQPRPRREPRPGAVPHRDQDGRGRAGETRFLPAGGSGTMAG